MNKYKKTLRIAPLVGVLSTTILFAPGTSFAAEKPTAQTQQVNDIKGYIIKNGVSIPVYNHTSSHAKSQNLSVTQDDGLPVLSSNPNDPVLSEGKTITEVGIPGKILTTNKDHSFWTLDYSNPNEVVGKIWDSNWTPGYFLTTQYTNPMMLNLLKGSKLIRTSTFKLSKSNILDRSASYQYRTTETTGISEEESKNFAFTIGASYSATAGGGVLPASATATYSASLEGSFGTRTTITSEKAIDETFSFEKAMSSYQYSNYRTAVYQLHSTYTFVPGPNLEEYLKNSGETLPAKQFTYNEDELFVTRTPGSGTYTVN
ncbi:hypothetical protein P4409_18650 [Bacillus thuringiensis]|nr:hypothetical protein [Bacillus thuringiensis]